MQSRLERISAYSIDHRAMVVLLLVVVSGFAAIGHVDPEILLAPLRGTTEIDASSQTTLVRMCPR